MESKSSELEKLEAAQVFEKVNKRLSSEKSQSLWRKMQSEMINGSVRVAVNWLESDLKQKSEQVQEELKKFKEV